MSENTSKICVYLLVNEETGHLYVGSTNNLKVREELHFRQLKKGAHHNAHLQRVYERNPNFNVESFPLSTRETARLVEQAVLDKYWGTPALLNIAKDTKTPMLGKTLSPEARARISEKNKGRLNPQAAEFTKTPAAIAKWRESRAGYSHSEETRQKIGAANSIALTGRTLPEEQRLKCIESLLKSNEQAKQIVNIDGVEYASLNDAARAHGLNPGTVHHRLRSNNPAFKDWKRAAA